MRRPCILAALLIALSAGIATAAERPTKPPTSPAATADKKAKGKPAYKGPTETDIRVAYTNKINAINAGTKRHLDDKAAAKFNIRLAKVDFVECSPVEDRADIYLCSILVESALGDADMEFKRVEVAMIKEKDAWRVE